MDLIFGLETNASAMQVEMERLAAELAHLMGQGSCPAGAGTALATENAELLQLREENRKLYVSTSH